MCEAGMYANSPAAGTLICMEGSMSSPRCAKVAETVCRGANEASTGLLPWLLLLECMCARMCAISCHVRTLVWWSSA